MENKIEKITEGCAEALSTCAAGCAGATSMYITWGYILRAVDKMPINGKWKFVIDSATFILCFTIGQRVFTVVKNGLDCEK